MAGMASRQRAIARMDVLPLFHVIYLSRLGSRRWIATLGSRRDLTACFSLVA
jgi:hypothetical protein